MARSQITVTDITRAGVVQAAGTASDATNDHYIAGNDGAILLRVVSTDGGAQTIDIVANPDLDTDGLTFSDLTLSIGAGETKYFGPFRVRTFKQAADSNRVYLNPSVSTTLTISAYRLTNTP